MDRLTPEQMQALPRALAGYEALFTQHGIDVQPLVDAARRQMPHPTPKARK